MFLGRSVTQHKSVSEETAHLIDEEIRSVIDRNYGRAESLLRGHMDALHMMAEALMTYETIDRHQIDDIMNGRTPGAPESWDDTPGSGAPGGEARPSRPREVGTSGRPAAQH